MEAGSLSEALFELSWSDLEHEGEDTDRGTCTIVIRYILTTYSKYRSQLGKRKKRVCESKNQAHQDTSSQKNRALGSNIQ